MLRSCAGVQGGFAPTGGWRMPAGSGRGRSVLQRSLSLLLSGLCCLALLSLPVWAEEETGFDLDYYGRFRGQNLSINVFNWGEYISDGSDGSLNVNKAFEELTGITVNYATFATNEELYSKLKGGGARYDIVIPSDYMVARMIEEGMLEPLDFANIPNFENIYPQYRNPEYDPENLYSVPYTAGTVGIIYNTTRVQEPVESWGILWDERYSGDILMFSNSRDAFGVAEKYLGFSLNTTDPAELTACANLLLEQKPLVQAYVMDEIFDKMISGEAAIAPYYAGDYLTMADTNEDLAFSIPKEGTNLFVDAICIPKGAQQKEAAEMYVNFMCEGTVAADNITYIGYTTPNSAAYALLDPEIQEDPVSYPPAEVLENTEPFLALDQETGLLLDSLWTEVLTTDSGYNKWAMPVFVVVAVALSISLTLVRRWRKKRDQFK